MPWSAMVVLLCVAAFSAFAVVAALASRNPGERRRPRILVLLVVAGLFLVWGALAASFVGLP